MPSSASSLLRWGWLLGVALLGPAALPAGGAERRLPQIRRQDGEGPLLSGSNCLLQAGPGLAAPALRRLEIGTPLQLLRHWRSADGRDWIQVQVGAHPAVPGVSVRERVWFLG